MLSNKNFGSKYHLPSLSILIKTGSYLFLSKASKTFLADCIETSCSADFPPKIIAILILLIYITPAEFFYILLSTYMNLKISVSRFPMIYTQDDN